MVIQKKLKKNLNGNQKLLLKYEHLILWIHLLETISNRNWLKKWLQLILKWCEKIQQLNSNNIPIVILTWICAFFLFPSYIFLENMVWFFNGFINDLLFFSLFFHKFVFSKSHFILVDTFNQLIILIVKLIKNNIYSLLMRIVLELVKW